MKRDMISSIRVLLERQPVTMSSQDSLHARFARGVAWSLVSNLVSQGLKLVASVVSARLLGQVSFGELGMINSTVMLFGVFAGSGLGMAATKYVAELRSREPEQAGRVIGFLLKLASATGGFVALVVFLFAPLVASRALDAPHLAIELRIGCAMLVLNALNGVQLGALAGMESFRSLALVNFVGGLVHLPSIALGSWFLGLRGVVGAYVAVAVITWLISQIVLRHECASLGIPLSYQKARAEWSILWEFALPALVVSMSTQPFAWLARVLLANQPNGYAEVGIFTAAFSWTNVLLFLPQQVSQPSMPILSNLYGQGRTKAAARLIRTTLSLTVTLSFLVAMPLMLLSPHIMGAYGESFGASWLVLVIILVAYTVGAGTLVFRNVFAASGRMWWQALHSMIWGIALVGIAVLLAGYGALGLSVAYLIAFIALLAIQTAFLSRSNAIASGVVRNEN